MPKYSVREMSKSDDPADEGNLLKRFENWDDAKQYRDDLYHENGMKTYISISY